MLRGDVDEFDRDPERPPRLVLQAVVRDRPRVLTPGVGRGGGEDELVQQRVTAVQYAAHRGLDPDGVHEAQHLTDGPPDMLLGGPAVHALKCGVDHEIPQVGVHDAQADRGLRDQPGGEREVAFHGPQDGAVGGDAERVVVPVRALQPHVAELHQAGAAVLVADGEGPGPPRALRHHLGEQCDDEVPVPFVDHQPGRVPSHGLPGAVAEDLLGLGAPEDHAPLRVEHHRRDAQRVQQAAGRGRGLVSGLSHEGFGRLHRRRLLSTRPRAPGRDRCLRHHGLAPRPGRQVRRGRLTARRMRSWAGGSFSAGRRSASPRTRTA